MNDTKAKLYKTARIAPWAEGLPAGLAPGQIVAVRYFVRDAMGQEVYAVSATQEFTHASPLLYARVLQDFVL